MIKSDPSTSQLRKMTIGVSYQLVYIVIVVTKPFISFKWIVSSNYISKAFSTLACAAASLAIGTLKGEQLT